MEPSALRFAVADGASETSFAKEWAELLVARFIAAPPQPADLRAWVEPMQATWAQSHLEKPAAWYAEQKARDGAFSSLLGLAIEDDKWRALAVGDSCLFVCAAGDCSRRSHSSARNSSTTVRCCCRASPARMPMSGVVCKPRRASCEPRTSYCS